MKTLVLVILNLALAGLFVFLIRRSGLLTYYREGRFWLTFFAVAMITLMDELTSVFYAPAEAYRFIGPSAIVFIAFTALFIHYMTTRLVEIASSFFSMSQHWKIATALAIVWGIAGLNVLGIRENARFVFGIFILAAFIFLNLIA